MMHDEHDETDSRRAALAELRSRQQAIFAEIDRGQRRFRVLARSVWQVGEEERRRVARDLHDGLGQNLTALTHLLERIHADAAPDARDALERAVALARATLAETRALAQALRPRVLDDLGLAAALNWLARTMGESGGYSMRVDIVDPLPESDDAVSTLLFRIAQEALTNVTRHAACAHAVVRLAASGGDLILVVADDGRGFDTSTATTARADGTGGSGLAGMRERVALFGGELEISSTVGAGSRVRAIVRARPEPV
jgi:two-component system sensor histidine kinase UhpB